MRLPTAARGIIGGVRARDVPPLPDDPGRPSQRILDGAAAEAGAAASGELTTAELAEQVEATLDAPAALPGALPRVPTDPRRDT